MRQPRSIRFHLAIVFLFFFLLVIVLGLFSVSRLRNFNVVSENIAEQWLPNTRVLGDLNNFTSDFRAVEGGNLLAVDPAEITATEKEIEKLDRSIAQAERNYEQIRHDGGEMQPVRKFQGEMERLPERRQPNADFCRGQTARTKRSPCI